MNQADTAWMLCSTALVLLMTPMLAFFYGGLVRSKNALNTMMMSFIALGFTGILWALVAYSLAFTAGNKWIGDLSNVFLRGVGLEPLGTIPHMLHMSYQATFAIITAALISGSIVERMRFSAYIVFISLWDSLDSIRAFAGDDITKARYYPRDTEFLHELEPNVRHLEVAADAT